MMKFEDIQTFGKEHFEQVTANATALQSGVQAIANAYGEYAKKQFEDTKSFAEKLSGVKSLDKVLEAQSEFARSAYETFVADAQKIAGFDVGACLPHAHLSHDHQFAAFNLETIDRDGEFASRRFYKQTVIHTGISCSYSQLCTTDALRQSIT